MPTQLLKTVKPSGGDYTTLEACLSANEQNLVTNDKYFDVEIDGTWSSDDTTYVSLDTYTTDATHYINIYTTSAARHDGIAGGGGYTLAPTGASFGQAVFTMNYMHHVRLTGIKFSGQEYFAAILNATHSGNNTFDKLLFTDCTGKFDEAFTFISFYQKDAATTLKNTIILDTTTGSTGVYYNAFYSNVVLAYNVTVLGCSTAGFDVGDNQTVKNCAAFTNGTDFAGGTNGTNYDYNASSDTSADDISTNGNNLVSKTASNQFVSVTTDLHLKSGADLIGTGLDLSGTFTDDIDGNTRSSWDIGADEYVAAGTTFNASPITIVGTVVSSTRQVTDSVSVNVITGSLSVIAPTRNISDSVTVSPVIITGSVIQPTPTSDSNTTVNTQPITGSLSVIAPSLQISNTKTVNVITGSLLVVPSTLNIGTPGTVNAQPITGTLSVIQPNTTISSSVNLSPIQIIASVVPFASLNLGSTIFNASAITGRLSVAQPLINARTKTYIISSKNNQVKFVSRLDANVIY